MPDETRTELINILDECDIQAFELNTSSRTLHIKYKEDFDNFYPKLSANPKVNTPEYGTPYHFGKVAFFYYNGWRVQGGITVTKSN